MKSPLDMPSKGFEIILGAKRDPSLGAIVMVGLGGIYVEIYKDISFGLAPLAEDDSKRMIQTLKAHKILTGFRGQKPIDVKALTEMLGRLSKLIIDFPEISEIDINPLLVMNEGEGTTVLDARIILS